MIHTQQLKLPDDITKEQFLTYVAETKGTMAVENWAHFLDYGISHYVFVVVVSKIFSKYIAAIRSSRS